MCPKEKKLALITFASGWFICCCRATSNLVMQNKNHCIILHPWVLEIVSSNRAHEGITNCEGSGTFYPTCRRTGLPATASWVQVENTRPLGWRQRMLSLTALAVIWIPVFSCVGSRRPSSHGVTGRERASSAHTVGGTRGEEPQV